MEIRENDRYLILAPLAEVLDKRETERLSKEILKEIKTVGIDLQYVSDCTCDFIETLQKLSELKNISVFNIPSDIFALFNFMNVDKSVSVYVSEQDFEAGRRTLINRKFTVV